MQHFTGLQCVQWHDGAEPRLSATESADSRRWCNRSKIYGTSKTVCDLGVAGDSFCVVSVKGVEKPFHLHGADCIQASRDFCM